MDDLFGGGALFNDQFFGDAHRQMRRQMASMDRMMTDLLGGGGGGGMFDPFGAVGGGRFLAPPPLPPQQQQAQYPGQDPRSAMLQHHAGPFGFGGGGLFGNVMRQMEAAQSDPRSHVYSHSTVISYDGRGAESRIYEATNSVRKAGPVKETRSTVRDSATGEQTMSIGHQLGQRAHHIEKTRRRGGPIEERQRFVNLQQQEAESFDREWAATTRGGERQRFIEPSRQVIEQPGASRAARTRTHAESSREAERAGPIIVELDDDDEAATPKQTETPKKRRKGVFGRLHHA